MEQIIITKKDGRRIPIVNRETATAIKSASQTWSINADDKIDIVVESATPQTYDVGDSIRIFGRTYRLNRMPKIKKSGTAEFEYTLEFEGVQYDLMAATYDVNIDTTSNQLQDLQGETLTGDLKRFMDVLVSNANRIFGTGTWIVGTCIDTAEDTTITFGESDNCLSVLQTLCDKFDCEFEIVESDSGTYTINMVEHIGRTLPYTFEYGRGRGLYTLNRDNVSSSNIITRLKAYGSTENITSKYRADRLCLPNCTKSQSVIQNNDMVAKYGIYEAKKYFDVKPTFTGSVKSVVDGDVLSFIDESIDFDLNAKDSEGNTIYLLSGQSAKVHFNSGNLAGYEFEIHSYDHATHKITLVALTDERDEKFPSETKTAFRFKVGDTYKLLDIALPDSIITAAEQELQETAETYYNENCQPRVQYSLTLEKLYLERKIGSSCGTSNVFVPGDYLHIVDDDIAVDKNIRVKSIERDLLDEYDYSLTISDTITTSITNRVISELEEIENLVNVHHLNDIAKARRNWMASRELLNMVFDTEGDYYTDKIKPMSIDTQMLAVGARSQQFTIDGQFMPNNGGDASEFAYSDGLLTHFVIEETTRMWSYAAGTITGLSADTAYYVYIVCNRTSTDAVLSLSTQQLRVDADASTYTFLVGVLSSAITGDDNRSVRILSLTYGSTTINGRTIQTGIIRSSGGGSCYFDLDNNEIGGIIKFRKSDGTYKDVTDVETIANASQDYINKTLPGIVSDIQNQVDGKIETWFMEDDPSTAWTTAKEKAKHIGDLWFNTTTNVAKRYTDLYAWSTITDADAIKALADAAAAQDTADGKRRVFTAQPTTPYDIGDLWVQGTSGDIMVCMTARATGDYTASDWAKATKYTGDESLNDFIVTYNSTISDIYSQLDGIVETWFGHGVPTLENEPASDWTTDEEKANHKGDIYYDNDSGIGYRFSKDGTTWSWIEISDSGVAAALAAAAAAQDTADGKRRVFTDTPYAPYDVGDLWANGVFLKVCKTARASGASYVSSDWEDATEYTGDESLEDFINGVYGDNLAELWEQIDGKIECCYTTTNPAEDWETDEEKKKHLGDQWYNTESCLLYRYTYGRPKAGAQPGYYWTRITDQTAVDAAAAAATAQDTADGKRRVFTDTPTTPYDVGDLWVQGSTGDIMVCTTARTEDEEYSSSDWVKASKYTDDSYLTYFMNVVYAADKKSITSQVDGKIETWFQESDPALSWTTTALKSKHVGDIWFKTSDNTAYRYTLEDSAYSWKQIQDKDALDALTAASTAQDTADGKRQVFVNTPYPPYDVGDLWVDGSDLRTCVTAKASGESYNINDWDIRVGYDNTQTTIDGGLVTSGTIQVAGDATNILAGMTGQDTGDTAVRFWGGASFENRNTAPFRVQQDGKFYATNGNITGVINAETGSIGGFKLSSGCIGTESSGTSETGNNLTLMNDFIKFANSYTWASIGTNVLPASSGLVGVARFTNNTPDTYGTNYGLLVNVTGGLTNIAISATGNIVGTQLLQKGFAEITPAANTIHIPGDKTTGGCLRILAHFTNSGGGIGFPSRQAVCEALGISNSTKFMVDFTIIAAADSTQTGYIRGRNSDVSGMNTNSYPYRLNNDASTQTGKLNMAKGDTAHFMLVWDGSTNYYAYRIINAD